MNFFDDLLAGNKTDPVSVGFGSEMGLKNFILNLV